MAMVPMGTNQTQARRASQSWSDMVRREGAQQAGEAGQNSLPSAGRAQSQQSPYANSTPYGQQQGAAQSGFQAYAPQQQGASSGQQRGGYQAYGQQQGGYQQMQLPPFQFTGGTDWMGNQYTNPNAMMAQQGAMAFALNQQRQGQIAQGDFGSLNPQMAYDQGAALLQQGFVNPFAAPQGDPYGNFFPGFVNDTPPYPGPNSFFPPPSDYGVDFSMGPDRQIADPRFRQQDSAAAIRNLLQGYGIPDNVMSQITGMFGGQAPGQQTGGPLPAVRPGPNGEGPEDGYWGPSAPGMDSPEFRAFQMSIGRDRRIDSPEQASRRKQKNYEAFVKQWDPGQQGWDADAYNRRRIGSPGQQGGQQGGTQPGITVKDAWIAAGRPGWADGPNRDVAGTASDGTQFGYRTEAEAYERWLKSLPPAVLDPPGHRQGRPDLDETGNLGLPTGLYRPENIIVDQGPPWHAVYYNPSTGETFRSYKNTVQPEEGSGWVRQGRERGSYPRKNEFSYPSPTPPGQQQTAQPGYGTPPDRRGEVRDAMFRDRDGDGVDDRDQDGPGQPAYGRPGQAQPIQDPNATSTPYGGPSIDQFRERQQQDKQAQFMDGLYQSAGLDRSASTDDLLARIVSGRGPQVSTAVFDQLPEDMRGALSIHSTLSSMARPKARGNMPEDIQSQQFAGKKLQEFQQLMADRAEAQNMLRREYGMSPDQSRQWLNQNMPLPDENSLVQELTQRGAAYRDQANQARADSRKPQPKPPTAKEKYEQALNAEAAAGRYYQTKPMPPELRKLYDTYVAEEWKNRGRG